MAKKKNTRASNGMGSIRQRPDGRWEARYTAPDGKQRSVYGKTEKEVTAKLRGKQHDIDSGSWREPSKMTVAEWIEIWLTDYQVHTSERTIAKYRCVANRNYIPVIGDLKVSKLLPLHIRHVVSTMQANGKKPSSVQNYIHILSVCLECAVEAGVLKSNPAKGVKTQRVPPKEYCIIDREDIPAFISAAKDTQFANELLIMLYTGMRIGEVRGLEWRDVDINNATLRVRQQLHPNGGGFKRITPPKYGEDRILHIPDEAVEILKDQRRKLAEMRLASGRWEDTELSAHLVFRLKSGEPHNDKTIYRAVKKAGIAIGKPNLHPHDLRHSYAVAALRSGVDVKTVQHNLGHKTAKMTLDVYAAYTDDAGKAGAEKLSAYLKNASQ